MLQVVDNSAHPLTLQAFKPCNRCGVVNVDTVRVDGIAIHPIRLRGNVIQLLKFVLMCCVGNG